MIAADTSSVIAFLQGDKNSDTSAILSALESENLVLPPVVIAELLSDPRAGDATKALVEDLPQLSLTDGYWVRAGRLRCLVLSNGHKARLGDALTAQACIDHNIPLIARDKDFRHFVRHCGLKLI